MGKITDSRGWNILTVEHSASLTYTAYFGFREKPFTLAPDPPFFYVHRACQEAYTTLLSGIRERKGFLLLTGETGTGKTSLLRRLMGSVGDPLQWIFLDSSNSPSITFEKLLSFLCTELRLPAADGEQLRKLQTLKAYLRARFKEGGTSVLLIDEAQKLEDEVLGNLRFLLSLDPSSETPLLQIVLVGQPELEQKLARPQLRQIKQRIALQCRLPRLEEGEVTLFIQHQLHAVGCEREDVFAPEAIQRIAVYSKGILRLIHLLCDEALLIAFGTLQKTISAKIIDEAAHSLGMLERREEEGVFFPENVDVMPVSAGTARAPSWIYVLSASALVVLLSLIGFLYYRSPAPVPSLSGPKPPVIQFVAPAVESGQEIVVAEGQQLTLTVEATSAQPGPLQYVWLLDGHERAQGPRWTYQPEFDEGGPQRKQVTVQVTDQANHMVEQSWQVQVQDVNRPPTIAVASPQDEFLEVKANETPQFAVQASDPDTDDQLAYVWFLDGQEMAHGQSWDFVPSTVTAKSQHRIMVAVSDKAGIRAEKEWTVAVVNASPQLPVITWVTPANQRVRVAEGQRLTLAVEATSAQPGPLQYVWLLDGHERAQGPRWTYQPEFDEGGPQRKQVTVQVTDQANHMVEQSWQVRVQDVNRPPIITAVLPSVDTIELAAGKEESFSVEATDPDADDQLVSVWSLDGQEVARGQSWRFRAPSTPDAETHHQVGVEVSDPDGLKNHFVWNIVIKMPSPQLYMAEANLLEVVPPSLPLLNETEIWVWLEAQRQAWQEKNVDTLVELGVMASDRADRSRKILSQYQSFNVILRNVEIHVARSRAQVSFSRIDVIDGKTIPHPDRKVFILEKQANGYLTARQP